MTRSHFSHVGMVYNQDWIFESHAGKNTRLNPLAEYKDRKFRVLRPRLSKIEKHAIKKEMEQFNGARYSLWDIAMNFTFSWLKPSARRTVVARLGSKKMMICSELIGRLLYNANSVKFKYLQGYGGLQPVDIFVMGVNTGMKEIEEAVIVPPAKIDVVEE